MLKTSMCCAGSLGVQRLLRSQMRPICGWLYECGGSREVQERSGCANAP